MQPNFFFYLLGIYNNTWDHKYNKVWEIHSTPAVISLFDQNMNARSKRGKERRIVTRDFISTRFDGSSYQSFTDSEMDMITFAESETHGQPGINANWCAGANVKVASCKSSCDRSSLFFRKRPWPLTGAESRRGSASQLTIVVVVLLMRQVWW